MARAFSWLAIVESDGTEQHAHALPLKRPCQPARHEVDVVRALQEIERGDGLVPDPIRGADDGGGDRAAHVDVEPGMAAIAVHLRETRNPREHAADEEPALADPGQPGGGRTAAA